MPPAVKPGPPLRQRSAVTRLQLCLHTWDSAAATTWGFRMPLRQTLRRLIGFPADSEDNQRFFGQVYRRNLWRGKASRSGAGSEGAFAERKKHSSSPSSRSSGWRASSTSAAATFTGCGKWLHRLDHYLGIDLVDAMIERNRQEHGSDRVHFLRANLSRRRAERSRVAGAGPFDLVTALDVFGHMLNAGGGWPARLHPQ